MTKNKAKHWTKNSSGKTSMIGSSEGSNSQSLFLNSILWKTIKKSSKSKAIKTTKTIPTIVIYRKVLLKWARFFRLKKTYIPDRMKTMKFNMNSFLQSAK